MEAVASPLAPVSIGDFFALSDVERNAGLVRVQVPGVSERLFARDLGGRRAILFGQPGLYGAAANAYRLYDQVELDATGAVVGLVERTYPTMLQFEYRANTSIHGERAYRERVVQRVAQVESDSCLPHPTRILFWWAGAGAVYGRPGVSRDALCGALIGTNGRAVVQRVVDIDAGEALYAMKSGVQPLNRRT